MKTIWNSSWTAPNPIYIGIEAKVRGVIEGASEAFCRYVQIAELLHNPCCIISCRGMLLSKTNVAPERRNEWKPCPTRGMESSLKISFKAPLKWESVHWLEGGKSLANREACGGKRPDCRSGLKALTGQRMGLPGCGSWTQNCPALFWST